MAEKKPKTVNSNPMLMNLASLTRQATQQSEPTPAPKQESAPIVSEAADGCSRVLEIHYGKEKLGTCE